MVANASADELAIAALEAHLGHTVVAAWFRLSDPEPQAPGIVGVGQMMTYEPPLRSPLVLAITGDALGAFDLRWPGPVVQHLGTFAPSTITGTRKGPHEAILTFPGRAPVRARAMEPAERSAIVLDALSLTSPDPVRLVTTVAAGVAGLVAVVAIGLARVALAPQGPTAAVAVGIGIIAIALVRLVFISRAERRRKRL